MPDSSLRLAIVGAAGRMGTSLLENVVDEPGLKVVAGIVNPDSDLTGPLKPGDVPVSTDASDIADADVVIDFSVPDACMETARRCAQAGIPLVSGTTGLSEAQWDDIESLSAEFPLLYAANFSVGVNLLADLVERATGAFGDDVDIEILEAHHRHKVDAPSGTAKMLGKVAAEARGDNLGEVAQWTRHGHTGERSDDEIGFQIVRGGDIVGEHTAFFCIEGERVELTHRATDRGIFARGALRAARWLTDRSAGRYDMNDVLFA